MDVPPEPPALSPVEKPRAFTVLVILLFCASMLSWLLIYAGPNALIAADMMEPWSAESDPRLEWWGISIAILLSLMLIGGRLVPWMIRRQTLAIDAIADAQDDVPDAVSALAGHSHKPADGDAPRA